ncbi:MAG TPA: helix-turn-helix transcriptional regulator [Terracidiphilus sp.]|nr:helix-turn-helix transcriptional regulator [Terracidiphilus sp.]
MPATRPAGELRECAAKLILQKLETLSIAEAACALGVSRQAIYGFKSGEYCPSLAVIQKACCAWNLEFTIKGMIVNKRSFTQRSSPSRKKTDQQITMFDLWEQLERRKMTVIRAEKVNGAVEMTLRISIPA